MKAYTLFALSLMLASTPVTSNQIYRWTDENGTAHFGTNPPGLFKGHVENMDKPAAAGSQKPPIPEYEDISAPPGANQDQAAHEEQLRQLGKEKQDACQQALKNRKNLLNSRRIQIKQSDGTRRLLSHEEKLEHLRGADEAITGYCEDIEE